MRTLLDFCDGLPMIRFGAGDVLLREGETSGRLYFVIEGRFEILKDGCQITVVSEPGAVFGELSVLLGLPHMATVRALADSEVYVVEGADDFLQAHSEINYHLSKMLAQRLHGVSSYLVDLKRQFEDEENHLGMVDEVLESLVNQQLEEFAPGSERDADVEM